MNLFFYIFLILSLNYQFHYKKILTKIYETR